MVSAGHSHMQSSISYVSKRIEAFTENQHNYILPQIGIKGNSAMLIEI
uniref:Uncharacterized protein n=1 Tax=Anguilla anguilla TaxID=7936 RepID=A0A0E9VBW4_ANGAN